MRRAAKVDKNQKDIVDDLRSMGFTVACNHDDILVGHDGKTYWYEIKGSKQTEIKPSQVKLLKEWQGHYRIVYSLEEILRDLGV